MKFENGKSSPFYKSLTAEVDARFAKTGKRRFANRQIVWKAAVLAPLYVGSYAGIYLLQPTLAGLVGLYTVFGLTGVMLVLNLVHDAAHGCLTPNRRLNNAVRYCGDVVGVNTYIWNLRHNMQHHSFTNVVDGDLIVGRVPLLRLSPHQPRLRYHRWQVWYATPLYLLYTLYWTFVVDLLLFCKRSICNFRNLKHPVREWTLLAFFKTLYVVYVLVLPLALTPLPAAWIWTAFFVMHGCCGLFVSFVAVLAHYVEETEFPKAVNGVLPKSWSEHELETAVDFAPQSRVIGWITGGLNTHVIHHLYPHICHVHYLELTPLLQAYCQREGYAYCGLSLWRAVVSHYRFLRRMGKTDVGVCKQSVTSVVPTAEVRVA